MAKEDKKRNEGYYDRSKTDEEINVEMAEEEAEWAAKKEAERGVKEPATTEIVRHLVGILQDYDLTPQDLTKNVRLIEAYINS